jgi:hypothetical protein
VNHQVILFNRWIRDTCVPELQKAGKRRVHYVDVYAKFILPAQLEQQRPRKDPRPRRLRRLRPAPESVRLPDHGRGLGRSDREARGDMTPVSMRCAGHGMPCADATSDVHVVLNEGCSARLDGREENGI